MSEKRFRIEETIYADFVDNVTLKNYCYAEGIDLLNKIFELIDKEKEYYRIKARKCRNQGNVEKAIYFEESVMTLSVLETTIQNELKND